MQVDHYISQAGEALADVTGPSFRPLAYTQTLEETVTDNSMKVSLPAVWTTRKPVMDYATNVQKSFIVVMWDFVWQGAFPTVTCIIKITAGDFF